MKKIILNFLLLFLFGCAISNPFLTKADREANKIENERTKIFPISVMRGGLSLEDVKKIILYNKPIESNFPSPRNPQENLKVLEYSLIPANCAICNEPIPHSIVFHQDKLIFWTIGDSKDSEFQMNKMHIEDMLNNKKITYADAERALYKKIQELYKTDAAFDEFSKYKIMIAEKIDKGEITWSEGDYLVSKKKGEMEKERQAMEFQKAQALYLNAIERQRRQEIFYDTLMQFGNNLMNYQPRTYYPQRQFLECQTRSFGNTTYTDCY